MGRALERLPPDERRRIFSLVELESEHARRADGGTNWARLARPEQLPPPGDWRTWMLLAGRGFGKTRAGAEAVNAWALAGIAHRIAIVAQTMADVRDLSMAALRRAAGPEVTYSETGHPRLRWSNGAEAIGFSADEPKSLRGYEFDAAWCDELAAWRYPEAYDQLQFGLRAPGARQIVTTTPRPVRLVRQLLADPTTIVTRGHTLDNAANLDSATLRYLVDRYGGTRLGRQELEAELLDDVEGALWSRDRIDELRVATSPDLVRVVVAIDPAVSSAEDADETGIIVVGKGVDRHAYLLADLSMRAGPDAWARAALAAYRAFAADRIVAEVNQGGDLVEATIRTVDPTAPYRAVHASKGKRRRAEPIAALYEQGRVHHVGAFPALEDQLCAALPDRGTGPDDRLDALVWGLSELDIAGTGLDVPGAIPWAHGVWFCARCRHGFMWMADRPCPRCGQPALSSYPEPGDPAWADPTNEASG